jgi:hypothetical protein
MSSAYRLLFAVSLFADETAQYIRLPLREVLQNQYLSVYIHTIRVYRHLTTDEEKHLTKFGLFVNLFPQSSLNLIVTESIAPSVRLIILILSASYWFEM